MVTRQEWEDEWTDGWMRWARERETMTQQWKRVGYLRQGETRNYDYLLTLPTPLADWDVWDYWEREHITSVRDTLGAGDLLIEIGAEHGWMSCVFGHIVGPENMVLIEPTAEFWPNIRATWGRNHQQPPRAAWRGLFGASANTTSPVADGWPSESDGPMAGARAYTYLHEHPETPTATLDLFVAKNGTAPKGITVDVEGAELEVMRGAEDTLTVYRPVVWLAVHPDLMRRDYGTDPVDLHRYMGGLGYRAEWLATDHEEHWVFRP